MAKHLVSMPEERPDVLQGIQSLIKSWQENNHHNGFGQCLSCRFHQATQGKTFQCGLTGEFLANPEKFKICREHDFIPENL